MFLSFRLAACALFALPLLAHSAPAAQSPSPSSGPAVTRADPADPAAVVAPLVHLPTLADFGSAREEKGSPDQSWAARHRAMMPSASPATASTPAPQTGQHGKQQARPHSHGQAGAQ